VQNNPVNWIDPWGLQADTIPWPVIIPARLLPVLAPALVNPVTIAIGAGLVVGGQKNSQAMMRSMILVPAGSGSQTNLTVKNKAEKLAK